MHASLPKHEIVLLGVGHTNAHVLRMWRMSPIRDARLTCVSNHAAATYSGMLPGVLAGQYPPEEMEIDLVRLCAAAGARLIVGQVTGLDVTRQHLLFAGRPALPFDALSIGIGSVPDASGTEIDETALAIKPMQTFLERLDARLASYTERPGERPLRVTVVGAGVGGVEVALCLPAHVRGVLPNVRLELSIVGADDALPTGAHPRTQSLVQQELRQRGVRVHLNRRATRVCCSKVTLDNGDQFETDVAIWATSAAAPPLLGELELPHDERGFLLTLPTLQTTAGLPVFAVGDSGTIAGSTTPKAGVYAVRQGPVLWQNLQRIVKGEAPRPYVPQRGFLKLLNTGDGQAIAEYKGRSFRGRWCWWLKDQIDVRFMDKYRDYAPMEMSTQPAGAAPQPMRCAGCGGKVSGSVLRRVLDRLDVPPHEHVVLGLEQPDDAAIVQLPAGRPLTVTADFFTAPLDDPYLVGRIAALNAASDVFALGADPLAALALVTLPVGREREQVQLLYELLAGSLDEFRQMGATLIGGHTIEGAQLTVGFTMLADQRAAARTKAQLKPGDMLVLTKPLGTGILLAAHMQARCRADWMQPLLKSMLLSNLKAAQLAEQFEIAALTDVTGFGLAGHLLEMLEASDAACQLQLAAVPLLAGAAELIAQGIESTLAPANRGAELQIRVSERARKQPQYQALFDPQTSGGLLLGAPQAALPNLLEQLAAADHAAQTIGIVQKRGAQQERIAVVEG